MNPHLLLVEDDRSIREVTTPALERAGFGVTACGHGSAALRLFAQRPYDAVLLDVMLPGGDGSSIVTATAPSLRTEMDTLRGRLRATTHQRPTGRRFPTC